MQRLPIFHIGLAKSGTTTLQKHFFSRHPDIHYLGAPYDTAELESAIRAIALSDEQAYAADEIHDILQTALESSPPGQLSLISHEILAGITARPQAYVARRLKNAAGDARIVITVREQKSLLRSRYLYSQKQGHVQPFENWWQEKRSDYLPLMQFDSLAATYEAEFGKGAVGIFVFEEMVSEPEVFLKRLTDFLGISTLSDGLTEQRENPGFGERAMTYAKLRQYLFPGTSLAGILPGFLKRSIKKFIAGGRTPSFVLPQFALSDLQEAVEGDNKELAKRTSASLAAYGYIGLTAD